MAEVKDIREVSKVPGFRPEDIKVLAEKKKREAAAAAVARARAAPAIRGERMIDEVWRTTWKLMVLLLASATTCAAIHRVWMWGFP